MYFIESNSDILAFGFSIAMSTLSRLIGDNIRAKRKNLNIKQDELALLAEIDRSYMGRIERGEVNITVDKLYQIANTLKCEATDLLPEMNYVSSFQTN